MTEETPEIAGKRWYQKWWVWLLIVLGVLIALAAFGSTLPDEEESAAGTSTTAVGETTTTEAESTTTTEAATTTTVPSTTTTTLPPTTTTTLPPFEPILIEGSGNDVVDIDKPNDAMITTITGNAADRFFAVTSYDANNNRIESLVSTTEPYEGTRPLDWLDDEWTVRLEVEGQGPWTILIEPALEARLLTVPGTIEGNGDDVFFVDGGLDTAFVVGNAGGRFFSVRSYGSDSGIDSIVSTTDPFEGRVIVPRDAFAFEVEDGSSGDWTITFE